MNGQEQIRAVFDNLRAQADAIRAETKPLREERDRLLSLPLVDTVAVKQLETQYLTIEAPLFELDTQISGLARTLGGKRLSDAAAGNTEAGA